MSQLEGHSRFEGYGRMGHYSQLSMINRSDQEQLSSPSRTLDLNTTLFPHSAYYMANVCPGVISKFNYIETLY